MFNACRIENVKLVQTLVSQPDCDTLYVNPVTKETPAHIACRINRLDILRVLVHEEIGVPLKCHQLNHLNQSLLHLACENDAEDVVNFLIDNKVCDVNSEDYNGHFPLHIATLRGSTAIVKKLLMSHTCKIDDMDKDKNTVLHYACTRDQLDSNLILTLCEFIGPEMSFIEKQNINGYTPVHYTCENGGVQVLQCLLEHFSHEEVNKALCSPNKPDKNTPLHLAFKGGRSEIISYLLKCTELASGVTKAMSMQNDVGNNIFHLSIDCKRYFYHYGTQKLMPQLVSIIEIVLQSKLQDNDIASCLSQMNSQGYTPMHYLIKETPEHNQTQTRLILSCLLNCNRSDTFKETIFSLTSSSGDTLVHLAVARGLSEIFKFLVIQKLCFWNPTALNHKGETPLHVACVKNNTSMVKLLLECDAQKSLKILNKENHPPLFYAKDRGIINCLIMNGADPSDVAESGRVKEIMMQLEKYKLRNPLNPTVTVIVLGNSLAGKTTLIKSLTKAYKWKQINPSIGQISEESERTVGVDRLEYKFPFEDGVRLLFYDYAGQQEFHSTNFMHLQNLMSNSQSSETLPLLFLIVVDINTESDDYLKQLTYWTDCIENCKSLCVTGVPDIVVIGSHADKVDNKYSHKEALKEATNKIEISETVKFIEYPILLDCREPSSNELQAVKKLLMSSTETLKKNVDLDNRCHMVFSYLYKHFSDSPVKFTDFLNKLREQKPIGYTPYGEDYPLSVNYYINLLKLMHGRQHIFLIGDLTEDFWILTAKAHNLIFSKIHGKLFAGASFKQHIHIQSNVGVLSSSFLRKTFPDVDYQMLQEFLVCSELCKKIEDEVVLNLIEQGSSDKQEGEMECSSPPDEKTGNSSLMSTTGCTNEQCYFFFPGLIKATKESLHIQTHEYYNYSSAWLLKCTNGNPRFLQVLLLRLMFKFAASSNSDTKLHRECTVWNNGLFWSNEGVEMLVEVTDQNKTVVFFLRCLKHPELKAIELRSAVIKEVIEVKSKYCPTSGAQESFLCNPSLDERGSLVKPSQDISKKELASAVINGDDTVKDTTGQYVYINKSLLCFEPYAETDSEFLKSMLDPEQADQPVPDDILSSLYTKSADQLRPIVTKFKEKISELERPISYQHLRDLFDKYSIFCGRNPKVS